MVKVIGADRDFSSSDDSIICPECHFGFKSFSPSRAMTCPACGTNGFQFSDNVSTCAGCGTRGECIVIDNVHYKVWVPLPLDALVKFTAQTGANGNRKVLNEHETKLLKWLTAPPKTTRYMSQHEKSELRKEIVDALLAYGATRERAEELTAGLTDGSQENNGAFVATALREISAAKTSLKEEMRTADPFLDTHGDLVVPIDCDPRYRWWDGGESIAETMDELMRLNSSRLNPAVGQK